MKRARWLGCIWCVLATPTLAGNPLQALQSSRGQVVVDYERAVAGEEAFATLATHAAPTFAISLVPGTRADAGRAIADAYRDGMRTPVPGAVFAEATPATAAYLVEIDMQAGEDQVQGTEKVYGVRSTGVSCKARPDGVVSCNEVGSGGPVALGTRPVDVTEAHVSVRIRLYRLGEQGTRSVVSEDVYSLTYRDNACADDTAAAATIATALARAALASEPLHVRFNADANTLGCGRG